MDVSAFDRDEQVLARYANLAIGNGSTGIEDRKASLFIRPEPLIPLKPLIPSDWDPPIPFGELDTPDISPDFLPVWLRDYVHAVSTSTQTPTGLSVMLGLSVVATCLQKKFEVSPYGDSYREPLNIWTITALPPASRKSAVSGFFNGPLNEWERVQGEIRKTDINTSNARRAVELDRIDKLRAEAAKTSDSEDRANLIKDITALQNELPDEERPPKLYTSDVTPERIQQLLVEHGERMAVLADEGGIFEVMAGLYSDGRANIDVFLQSHSGNPVRVDRGSRTAHLEKPALTFGLAVQPEIIKELSQGSKRKFRGTGALARFLYCMPASNIGRRDVRSHDTVGAAIRDSYKNAVERLLNIPVRKSADGTDGPIVLTLDSGALELWHAFSDYIEKKQGAGKEFESIQDWTGKLPGAALRIAGLCHAAQFEDSQFVIQAKVMEGVLDFCESLIKHAQAAFSHMGEDQATADASVVYKWILTQPEGKFKKTDCHRALHGRFKKVDRLMEALKILFDRNIISGPYREPTQKPTIVYFVNPAVLKEIRS